MPENENSFSSIVGMDPNTDWYLRKEGPGFRSFEDNPIIPFILTLHDDAAVAALKAVLTESECPIGLFAPDVDDLKGVFEIDKGKPLLAFTTEEYLTWIRDLEEFDDFRNAAKEIKVSAPISSSLLAKGFLGDNGFDNSVPKTLYESFRPELMELPEGSVVMGVIDDGISLGHDAFLTKTGGTRIQYFWNMDKEPGGLLPFGYGNVMDKTDIDDLIANCSTDGALNEDKFYRLAGLSDFSGIAHKPVSLRLTHGTHVLDMAAGYEPEEEIATRPIIAVQLPVKVVEEMSKEELDSNIFMGILFILLCASNMSVDGKSPPVVINISYGYYGGPHDGTAPLELVLDSLVSLFSPNLKIVLPSGNGNLTRCHAEFTVGGDTTHNLEWTIEPDDFTDSKLNVWLPERPAGIGGNEIKLKVTAPDGTDFGLPDGTDFGPYVEKTVSYSEILLLDGKEIGQLYFYARSFPRKRGAFFLNLEPTMAHTSDGSVPVTAPFGNWTVNISSDSETVDQEIQAWIDRDETLHGYPIRGRQSYFSNDCYKVYDPQGFPIYEDSDPAQPACIIKRTRMTNGLATGYKVFVAGGFQYRELDIAPYSAGGTFSTTTKKPDAPLLSDISNVHTGMLAAGSRRGSVVAMNGTSVASPLMARTIADFLGDSVAVDRTVIKDKAMVSEAGLPAGKPANSAVRGGWGRWIDVSKPRIDSTKRVF